ncbi:MAG TPA: hypothetical protein VK762_35455, partial [Polyangiaceae bacterium]|nr:hypothetical protein [Polyangiaceae bacterium]
MTCTVACNGVLAPNPSDAGVPYAGAPDASVEPDAECSFSTTVGNARVHLHLANGSPLYGLPFVVTGPSPNLPGLFIQIADASDVVFVAGGLPADGPDTIGV